MAIYFGLIVYIVLLHFLIGDKTSQKRKQYCFLVFLALFFIQALRATSVGVDLTVYHNAFNIIKYKSLLDGIKYANQIRMEPGLPIFFWFVGKIFNNWQWAIVLSSLFVNGVVCKFAHYTTKKPLVFFLTYIGLGLFVFSFSGLRQMCAIAFTMLAFICFCEKKYIRFIVLVLCGCVFHVSALVMLTVVIAKKIKLNLKTFVFLLILMAVILCFGNTIARIVVVKILPRYSGYLKDDVEFGLLGVFYMLTFVMLFFMYYSKGNVQNSMLLFLVALAACFQMFGNVTDITSRITIFFVPYVAVALADCEMYRTNYISIATKKQASLLYCAFICIFLFVPEIVSGYLNVSPYKFFWAA